MDILLTGRHLGAEEAKRIGLFGRLVPNGTALAKAKKIAGDIAANGPFAVQSIKNSVQLTEGLPEDEALKIELDLGWKVFNSDDAKEGPRAFAEKRKRDFKGR